MKLEKKHLDALKVLNLTPFATKREVQAQQDSLIKLYRSIHSIDAKIQIQEIIAAANLLLKEVFG